MSEFLEGLTPIKIKTFGRWSPLLRGYVHEDYKEELLKFQVREFREGVWESQNGSDKSLALCGFLNDMMKDMTDDELLELSRKYLELCLELGEISDE